jgi:hypothetical protein
MLHVSFYKTVDAYRDRTKTETRRFWTRRHAKKFKPGVEFMGITKDFRAGGKTMHISRVISCEREMLLFMNKENFEREGGTRYWKNLEEFIEKMGGHQQVVYVLRFEHCHEPD